MLKNLYVFALLSVFLCGYSDPPAEVNFYIISFKPFFKSCSSTTCATYMESVVEVHNRSKYPTETILNCVYYMDNEPHSNISTKMKLDIGEKKTVNNTILFTTSVNDVSFYSVFCELLEG